MKPFQVDDAIERLAEHTVELEVNPLLIEQDYRKRVLEMSLELEGGNQVKTARRLGVHRNTLRLQLRRYEVKP